MAIAFETKLAGAHLRRVEMRDPKNLYHLVDRAWLDANAAGFAWHDWFSALGLDAVKTLNVGQPAFFTRFADTGADDAARRCPCLPSLAAPRLVCTDARRQNCRRGLRLIGSRSRAPSRFLPRWKRCIRATDNAMAEALAPPFLEDALGWRVANARRCDDEEPDRSDGLQTSRISPGWTTRRA